MIFQKRGRWCYRDPKGKLHKFSSEKEAREFAVEKPAPVETFDEPAENPVTENGQDWKDWSPGEE